METKQLNLKLPVKLLKAGQKYANEYGFRNIQELLAESLRERVFGRDEYDHSFTKKEIELIDKIVSKSKREKIYHSEEELNKLLLQ